MKLPTEPIVWSMVLKMNVSLIAINHLLYHKKLFDVAKLNNIGRKVKIGLDAREGLIKMAGRLQKSIENVDECYSAPNYCCEFHGV